MKTPITQTKTYHLEFNTKDMPGKIVCWEVSVRKVMVSDRDEVFNINLSDDPAYPSIVRYVKGNAPHD